ncbi:MAG: hypothetical protein KGZ38_00870 [Erysipelothrix sp.]|nr:hypothetical protein [Erysipelothrix sp.]
MTKKNTKEIVFVDDPKRDYLVKTFSRTKRKDFENYILNSIWNKLNRLDIQPITQQYVRTTEGKYHLIDLYFPTLNIGIECDERHHVQNTEDDTARTLSIEEVLDLINVGNEFVMYRVSAYEDIYSINNQIDSIVRELKLRIDNLPNFVPWTFQTALEFKNSRSVISLDDKFRYRTVLEIAQVLGKNYKGIQRAYFPIYDNYYAWCPHLSVQKEGKVYYFGKNDWINTLSEDWETITETRANKSKMDPLDSQMKHLRVTFVKSKDIFGKTSYRFIGVYKFNEEKSIQRLRKYSRITTCFKIDYKTNY